ncbi:hypothetical protein [Kiloniella majae]|uniref:hypothetical protein n=1 Tax=Kiloniella majae TaxID=1938558 RepID=UPI000A2789B1|nr:hypothetical protein [Kiloniella majae]
MAIAATDERLHKELEKLVLYVERLRQELADAMRKKGDRTDFENMSVQLDALVKNTEEASNGILKSSEEILEAVEKLRADNSEEDRNKLCDLIVGHATSNLEACSFQDITGQRVTKILRSMQFVEDRVSTMAEIYGEAAIQTLGLEISAKETPSEEVAMDGPAIEVEEAISQDEIDALFD